MAVKNKTASRFPSFREPPVIEVVCGLRFEVLEHFKLPHIGLFWERVHSAFPKCEHASPLGFSPETTDPATGLPIPRVWLINNVDDRLIQIQNNLFYYNWRLRKGTKRYPRYKNIMSPFKKNFLLFDKFVSEFSLGHFDFLNLELTYVNHIPQGNGWTSPADYGEIFPDFDWRSNINRFLPIPDQIIWNTIFSLPDGQGSLSTKISHGTRKIDEQPILVLEQKAHGMVADKSINAIWSWFDMAHEWVVRGFSDITSSSIQKNVWKRDDNFTR